MRLWDEVGADVADAVDLDVLRWTRLEVSSMLARFVHVEFIAASELVMS